MELTNLKCEKAKPRTKPYRIPDRQGLHLLVMPAGGKLWRWKYWFDGKQKQMALGKFPDVSLLEARKRHADVRLLLAQGTDPMAVRKETKEQQKIKLVEEKKTALFTFEWLARQWLDWWNANRAPRYATQMEARLMNYVLGVIGKKPPMKISRIELVALMLQTINQIYEFGCDRGLIPMNPAAGIRPDRILSKATVKHFAHLPIAEIPALLCDMRDYNGNALTRIAMELLSLTFVRTSELIGGLWSEIDWEQKQWRIPPERMKMNRPHIVPLATQTVALLKRLYELTGESGRLFPEASHHGNGTLCHSTVLNALYCMGYKGRMTGHGWRSIASTWLHEHGFDHEQIELQLAHVKQDKVSAAYNFALYLEDRTAMMQQWADTLDELREQGDHRLKIVA
jgi:integrase